ncbi:hypothetical protein SAMN04488137_2706 [Fictibacillus solisalsi]|uniref:Spore coat protein B n=1 Tax=Fictibacillus solisalsi TaxID=459525 RepID=A0A1G9XCY5_9BACL|nr:hypothetical protein [Fictibacillus solisalsi]SDM94391.1 hypothetical protein SAMN04488137_2706 [Fictibacillus solisalsi]
MSDFHINSMVGKRINVNKGGPEAKAGQLLHSGYNYMVVGTDEGVVYYAARHLKSVGEDLQSDNNGEKSGTGEFYDYLTPSCFSAIMDNMIGQNVKVNRGGPESRQGVLLLSTYDYIALATEKEGVVYYKTDHVKSVSVIQEQKENEANTDESESGSRTGRGSGRGTGRGTGRNESPVKGRGTGKGTRRGSSRGSSRGTGKGTGHGTGKGTGRGTGKGTGRGTGGCTTERMTGRTTGHGPAAAAMDVTYYREYGFNSLFDRLAMRKVKINRGGPDAIEGVLTECANGYVVVLADNVIHRILTKHVKSISAL